MSVFGQSIPQNLKTDGVHSYLSFGASDTRSKPISRQDVSQKSTPGEASTYIGGRKMRAKLDRNQWKFNFSTI